MKLKVVYLIIGLSLTLVLGSCIPLSVDKLEIQINQDLSSRVGFAAVEPQADIQNELKNKQPLTYETFRTETVQKTCGFQTQGNYFSPNGEGFYAWREFDSTAATAGLEYALQCIPIIGQYIKIQPLRVNESLLGTEYEFQIEIYQVGIIREVQLSLPGKMELVDPISTGEAIVTTAQVRSNTVLWEISENPNYAPPSTPPPTPSSPSPIITLTGRSHTSKINFEIVLSIITALFGGGLIWQLIGKRRKET